MVSKSSEYRLVVEGNYLDETEAEHALRDPFIEEWVEQTGKFRIHNFDDIEVTRGISLGDLTLSMIDDEMFEITSRHNGRPLTEKRAQLLAETLERQAMFDEVRVEPLEQA
jgi:hypothetical protein